MKAWLFSIGMLLWAAAPAVAQPADSLVGAILRDAQIDEPAGQAPAARLYDERTLPAAALKRCLTVAHDVDQSAARIVGGRAELERRRAEMDRLERGRRPREDGFFYMPPAELEALNRARREWLVRATQVEAELSRNSRAVATFNSDCAGRGFYAADLAAVAGELPFDLGSYRRTRP